MSKDSTGRESGGVERDLIVRSGGFGADGCARCAIRSLETVNRLADRRREAATPWQRGALTRRINHQLDHALMWIDASLRMH